MPLNIYLIESINIFLYKFNEFIVVKHDFKKLQQKVEIFPNYTILV